MIMKKPTPFGELEICDAHAHFFSRHFFATLIGQSAALARAEDAFAQVAALTGWTMPPESPAELALQWQAELDRHQVAAAMLMSSVPNDESSIAAAVAACPERVYGGFFINPHLPYAIEHVRRAFDEWQLRVVCLFPAMFHFSLAENETVRAIVALASEHPGTAVLVHCGVLSVGARKKLGLPSKFDLRYSNPLDIHKLAAEFTAARFIIPHFGAGLLREALLLADLCPNVYLDTSSSNAWMKYEGLDLATVFRRALAVVGTERLLFGTDSSFFPRGWVADVFAAQCEALQTVGVTEPQAAAIFGGNLRRLFQR
jgi:hypothetical protein